MANRAFMNFGHMYANHTMPVMVDCNFIVDSQNGNNLGIRSLKSNGYVKNVFMNVQSSPVGSPALGTARSFAILGASAVTNTGDSVLTGNLGISPGTSITGFPPGTFSGQEHIADLYAHNAQLSALAAYTDLQARSHTGINSTLDGQSLTAGVYKATSGTAGTFELATSGNGTLTLTGSATDIFVFQMDSTLLTGAGGVPTITLVGGVKASNIYWVVGSSATINSGSAGTFQGNIIAHDSITDTIGGTVNGSLIALNAAVTLSAASLVNAQPSSPSGPIGSNPNPMPGIILVQLSDNYARYLGGFSGEVSPLVPGQIAVNSTNLNPGQPYVITTVGTTTQAEWQLLGLPAGLVPAVGMPFIATRSGQGSGSGKVEAVSVSGITNMEAIGNSNLMLGPQGVSNQGGWLMFQTLSNDVVTAPTDNSVISMAFYMDNSSVTVDGD
jgi:hypothetical protein